MRALVGSVIAGGAGQLALMVSGVLAARVLGVEDRGWLALVALVPTVLAHVGSLGMPLASTYVLVQGASGVSAIRRVLGRIAPLQIGALLLAHAAFLIGFLAQAPDRVLEAGVVSLVAGPSFLLQHYGLAVLQGSRRFAGLNLFRVMPAACYATVLLAVFLAGFGNLLLITALWVASNVVAAALTLFAARYSRGDGSAQEPSARRMLWFGLRSYLGSFSPTETLRIDQLAVGLFLSPAMLGLYVVGVAFSNIPRFIGQSIGMVAYPEVARATSPLAWRLVVIYSAVTLTLCGAAVTLLQLVLEWLLPLFFGEEFSDATPVTRILLFAALLFATRRVLADCARGLGHPGAGTAAEVVSLFALLVILPVVTPAGRIEGVAAAVLAAAVSGLAVLLAVIWRARPAQ